MAHKMIHYLYQEINCYLCRGVACYSIRKILIYCTVFGGLFNFLRIYFISYVYCTLVLIRAHSPYIMFVWGLSWWCVREVYLRFVCFGAVLTWLCWKLKQSEELCHSTQFCVNRRKRRLIERNEICRHLKICTCKGTLRRVFICLRFLPLRFLFGVVV